MLKASKLSGLRDQSGISKLSVLTARQNAQTAGVDHLIEFTACWNMSFMQATAGNHDCQCY
jgi:23S rRNA G2445 N2-methylase RlmL